MSSFYPLALVGMDAALGSCDGLDAFERVIADAVMLKNGINTGSTLASATPSARSLLEKIARRALNDAAISVEAPGRWRTALVVAGAGISNLDLPAVMSEHDLSSHANPLAGALDIAARLLSSNQVDAVVYAAQSGAGSLPNLLPDPVQDENACGLGFDRAVHNWRIGAGTCAVVWMSAERAAREGRRIYAVLRAVASRPGKIDSAQSGLLPVPPSLEDVRTCCREALNSAGVSSNQVGYIEAFASGLDALDGIEIAGLVQSYRLPEVDTTAAIGSAQSNLGYLGAAAGVAGLIRAALCLYHRMIPGVPNWNGPKLPALWRSAPFYAPVESRPWFMRSGGGERVAAVNLIGLNGSCAHLVLSEPAGPLVRPNQALAQGGFYLFPMVGDNLAGLEAKLQDLKQALQVCVDPGRLACEWGALAQAAGQAVYGLSIVGHTLDEILREVDLALKALPATFERSSEWQTPLGSYFTASPSGRLGGVALVYPGAFNSYPGVGKDLFRLFPTLQQRSAALASDLGSVFRERMLYPRSLTVLSKEEMAALEARLLSDPIAMLISGTALSVLYTYILQETFGIQASAAFGYSLGENSMIYATGVWRSNGDEATARLEKSDAFRLRLAGPQNAIREFWGMPPADGAPEKPLWSNYLVMAAPEKVHQALADEPRVYMTHVNTPRQVVIGGDPEACQRILKQVGASSLQAPFDYALHCEVMRSEYPELAELHNYPVENETGLRLYSAANYGVLLPDQAEIAAKMAQMLTSPLDFPHLINKVYEDGASVFIEAGAGSNCARWIDETLKGKPHLALAMNRRGSDDYHTLVRMLARLFSHRVPVRLQALYQSIDEKVY